MLINAESDVASTKLQNWKSIDLASIRLAFHYSFSNMDFFHWIWILDFWDLTDVTPADEDG